MKKPYTFIEVCAGAGGLSSGLIRAGMIPLLLNDNNKDCCDTLKKNHGDVKVVCQPMEKIDFLPYTGKVDVLVGGVPCQSFSQAGKRRGIDDPRGHLILVFRDIVSVVCPRMFVIENVKGLLSHNNGKTIADVVDVLKMDGMYTVRYQCLDASRYGVPQKRQRVFIIGTLHSLQNHFVFPPEDDSRKVLKDVLHNVPPSFGAQYNQQKKDLFKMIPPGGCWVDLPKDLQKKYLGKSFFSGGGKRGILHRLDMEKPCLTLLCTPSQKQTERCHPYEERPLTLREYARIQTFEDEYEFCGSVTSQYRQIGNAVPIELARRIGEAIVRYFERNE